MNKTETCLEHRTIVKVTAENLMVSAVVYCESWYQSHKEICKDEFLSNHTVEYQYKYLQNKLLDGWDLYLCCYSNSPVGIVGLLKSTGEIGLLYISPEHQHNGHGTYLLDFAVHKMLKLKRPHLYVLNTNIPARHLYEKYGFEYTGEFNILSIKNNISEFKYTYNASAIKFS